MRVLLVDGGKEPLATFGESCQATPPGSSPMPPGPRSTGPGASPCFPAWLVWAFVHIVTLSSVAGRIGTLTRWAGAMIGHKRDERNFSVGHTGGDVSLPAQVRAEILATESEALARISGNGDGKAPKNGS